MTDQLPPMKRLNFQRIDPQKGIEQARGFAQQLATRRTVRAFSPDQPPHEILQQVLAAANTAPSGANKQPWTFVVVTDPELKQTIREGAEAEEKVNYEGRMSEEWLEDLRQFRTDWHKEFLEIAPALIVVFAQSYGMDEEGNRLKHYYVQESVGLACGMLIAAAHLAGLATLTHTPSPMKFLSTILERPSNERPFLLIPIGYPAPDAEVPDLPKKGPDEVVVWK